MLFRFLQLSGALHEVVLDAIVTIVPDCEHSRLGAHVTQVGTVEALGELDDGLVIDLARLPDGARVDLEDLHSGHLVRERDLNLTVDAAGTEKGRVERVGLGT